MTFYRRQLSKPSPRKRNEKDKMVVLGGLKIAENKREAKAKEIRENIPI